MRKAIIAALIVAPLLAGCDRVGQPADSDNYRRRTTNGGSGNEFVGLALVLIGTGVGTAGLRCIWGYRRRRKTHGETSG